MNERIKGKSPHEEEATMNKTTKQIFQEVANGANLKLKDTKLRVALKVKKKVLYGRWSKIAKLSGYKLISFLYKKLQSGEIVFEYYEYNVFLRAYEKDNIINDDYLYLAIKPEFIKKGVKSYEPNPKLF